MKKLKKISAIMIIFGFGISIFSVAFLDTNVIVGFAGLIIALCFAFINICTRDKKKIVSQLFHKIKTFLQMSLLPIGIC